MVLTPLMKATEYAVQVWAFNDAGEGISALKTTWTGEDGKLRKVYVEALHSVLGQDTLLS